MKLIKTFFLRHEKGLLAVAFSGENFAHVAAWACGRELSDCVQRLRNKLGLPVPPGLPRPAQLGSFLSLNPTLAGRSLENEGHTLKILNPGPAGQAQHDAALSLLESLSASEIARDLDTPLRHKAERPRLLVHVCCGPDAGGVLQQLKDDYDCVAFWYDPNIQPADEHQLRLDAFLKVAQIEGVPALVGEYDVERFDQTIANYKNTAEQGAKCSLCYDMRLARAAREAKAQNCAHYTSTLLISPHKVMSKLKNFGELHGRQHGVGFLYRNFQKENGFKDSVRYTSEHEIFRQDYCGCLGSMHEGGPKARARAVELGVPVPTDLAPSQG